MIHINIHTQHYHFGNKYYQSGRIVRRDRVKLNILMRTYIQFQNSVQNRPTCTFGYHR